MTTHTRNQTVTRTAIADIRRLERELVAAHGDDEMLERYNAGYLPDDELLALARQVFFAPLGEISRFRRIEDRDLKHQVYCEHHQAKYDTHEATDLTKGQWALLKAIKEASQKAGTAAPYTCAVVPKHHEGWCPECDPEGSHSVVRKSAAVTFEWAGRSLTLEYGL